LRDKERDKGRDRGGRDYEREREHEREVEKERRERERMKEYEQRMRDYKPDVNIEYTDEFGKVMSQKEVSIRSQYMLEAKSQAWCCPFED
jgi:U4/U6.U5 tri-snRNP-associated protein 1